MTARGDNMNYGAKAAKDKSALNLNDMLVYAIQDEYLAREEYEIAINTFGDKKPFSSIVNSEVVHINWLKSLFKDYGFSVPADNAKSYLHIPESFKAALELGVEAEIDNIEMYDKFLKEDLPSDVKAVFTKLRDASKGHLFVLKRAISEE